MGAASLAECGGGDQMGVVTAVSAREKMEIDKIKN